ncbi:MAG: DUF2911 domain-containing protein, partial [Flammeovirgaceae bacterium]
MISKKLVLVLLIASIGGCQSKKTAGESPKDSAKTTTAPEDDSAIIEEQSVEDDRKGSLKAKATATLGTTNINIAYYSPAVRGRIIWGGLVPFDKVWVTGAHSATSIEFNQDIVIESKTIAAGKYAFFTIPGKEEWTIILNKNWHQHLTDRYDEKEDVLRVNVKPEVKEKNQERL